MAQDFEKTNFPWELRLWQQRTGEWFEGLMSGWKAPELPQNEPPPPPPNLDVSEGLFWVICLILLGLLIWKLYPTIERFLVDQSLKQPKLKTPSPNPALNQNQWLQQARNAKAQGNYSQAARALYFAAITRLQERELIAKEDSFTNGEYRSQLRKKLKQKSGNPKTDRAYQTLVNTHEALYYSDRETIDAQRYEDCDRAYRDLEQETP